MSPMVMGGIGAGVVLLLLMIGLASSGSISKKKETKKPVEAPLEELTDTTPAEVWAARAEKLQQQGCKGEAADAWIRAGEAADRRSPGSGTNYSMRGYDIKKFTTLPQANR